MLFFPIKYGKLTIEMLLEGSRDYYPEKSIPIAALGELTFCISCDSLLNGYIIEMDKNGEFKYIANSLTEFLDQFTEDPDE